MKKYSFVLLVGLFIFGGALVAQDKKAEEKAPAIATEDAQAVQILALKIQTQATAFENAQLRAQAAQAELERARGEFQVKVKSLAKDGWDLDLQNVMEGKLTYKKAAEKAK